MYYEKSVFKSSDELYLFTPVLTSDVLFHEISLRLQFHLDTYISILEFSYKLIIQDGLDREMVLKFVAAFLPDLDITKMSMKEILSEIFKPSNRNDFNYIALLMILKACGLTLKLLCKKKYIKEYRCYCIRNYLEKTETSTSPVDDVQTWVLDPELIYLMKYFNMNVKEHKKNQGECLVKLIEWTQENKENAIKFRRIYQSILKIKPYVFD